MSEAIEHYAYHLVPDNLSGEILMPLNELRKAFPVVYKRAASKYEGRERLMLMKVLPLSCLWNDTLMFSPVDPVEIRRALLAAGRDWPERKWFKVPLSKFDQQKSTFHVAASEQPEDLADSSPEEFPPFTIKNYEKFSVLSDECRAYFKSIPEGQKIFTFHYIPHLLTKDRFYYNDLKIVTA